MPKRRETEKALPVAPVPSHEEHEPHTAETRAAGMVGVLPENVAGALAYLTFIPAVLFLLVAPFRRSRFVRFHALQCLLCWGAAIVLVIGLKLAGDVVFLIPTAGPLFVGIIDVLAAMAVVFLWLVLIVKASQGEMFRLPLLGAFAEQYSEVQLAPPSV